MLPWLSELDLAVLEHLLDVQLTIAVDDANAADDTLTMKLVFAPNDVAFAKRLYVVHHGELPVLYENVGGNQNDWLQLDLVGSASNRDAVGAFVRLTAAPGAPEQVRETSRGSNYLSSDEDLVHFGLGPPTSMGTVVRIEIRWPSGQTTVLTDVPRNQRHTIIEP